MNNIENIIKRRQEIWKRIINRPVLDYDNERDRKEIEYYIHPKPDLNKEPEKHSKDYWDDFDEPLTFVSLRQEIRAEMEREKRKRNI